MVPVIAGAALGLVSSLVMFGLMAPQATLAESMPWYLVAIIGGGAAGIASLDWRGGTGGPKKG